MSNNGPINIFLSHRHEDSEAISQFRTKLEALSAGRLRFFQSSAPGQIQAGEDWRKRIHREIKKSDALILIFTDPSQTWDWCLYEVGLFTDLNKKEEESRIICLCSYEDKPPSPLLSRQFIRANKKAIRGFLTNLFKKTDYFPGQKAINPKLTVKMINELTSQLSAILSRKAGKREYFTKWLKAIVPEPDKISPGSIPADVLIEPYADCLILFGMTQTPPHKPFWTWGDLVEMGNLNKCFKHSKTWQQSVAKMVSSAKKGQIFKQQAHKLKAAGTQEFYRPILWKFETDGKGAMTFFLLFVAD
jgi:hypothetical protein